MKEKETARGKVDLREVWKMSVSLTDGCTKLGVCKRSIRRSPRQERISNEDMATDGGQRKKLGRGLSEEVEAKRWSGQNKKTRGGGEDFGAHSLNGSAWSTEKKYMRRYRGTFHIIFAVEHRMKKEEMEEQFNKEAMQGWRCAADAARIIVTTQAVKIAGTLREEFLSRSTATWEQLNGKEGAVESMPRNEGPKRCLASAAADCQQEKKRERRSRGRRRMSDVAKRKDIAEQVIAKKDTEPTFQRTVGQRVKQNWEEMKMKS